MILCLCRGVSDRAVEAVIAAGASSVAQIERACGAGGDCGAVPEQLRLDLDLERAAWPRSTQGVELCGGLGDNGTRDLVEDILTAEEGHIDWIVTVHGGIPVNLPGRPRGSRARPGLGVDLARGRRLPRARAGRSRPAHRAPARARTEPELAVVIQANTDVRHGRVVDVMDAARLAGVGKLAIAVTPRETRR